MEQESVWVVDPDPAFRTKAEEALREAGLEVTSLGEVGREPPWQEGDTVIAAVELLPVGGAPGTLVALVPPGDGAAQVKALQDGACWCMYRDPACLPQLPAILREVWAEEGLLAERQIYYRALEQMDEGVVVEDGEGYLTFVSPRALKMLGYEPGELEGRHYGEIVHPSDQGSAEAETHKRPRGIASQYECRLLHKDGSVIPAWVAATPLFEGEQFTGVIVTLRDISREKNLQERFSVLQQVAIAVGEASELGEILRRARRALGVLMEGVRDVVFAIADEDGEVLRPLIPQPGYPLVNLLVEALNKPLPRIQVPISRLPVEWRERIPQGQPCLSLDVLDLTRRMFGPEVAEAAARQGGVRSVAALPMRSGGMLRGMIFVTLERRHVYESDLDLGMVVANLVTAALENQSLLERVRHRMYNLDRLFELSQAMTASMEPVDLADVALRQFIQALDVDKARISLWDEQRNVLKSMLDVSCDQRSGDFRSQRVERVTLLDDSPSTQKVMESRQPLQIPLSDPEIDSHGPPLVWEKDIQMLVILPLLYKGECIGIVELGNSSNERRLASDQMNLAMTLAGQVAVAFENARLLKEARRRAVQLSTAAEVARHATGILDSETLLEQTVDLIRERFGFYYAAIFLLDGEGEQAILRAATGEAGEKMLEKDYALPVGAGSIVGHVAAEGEPWISNDVESDPRYLPDSLLPETRCELGLPLQVRGQVIGVLDVQSTQIAGFSSDDVATLQTLADQVAGAIENARLHEAQRRRLNELSGLYEISRAITAVLDLRDLVEVVNQQVSRFADVPIFYIALWERETDTIRLPVIVEEDQRLYDQEVDWEGLVGWVLRHGEPLLTADLSEEESIPADVKPIFVGPSHPRSVLIVPLTVGDRIIGVLSVQSEKVGIYNQDDLDFLSAVASQVAIAVDNARLFEEARIHAEELAALNELGQALTAHLDAEEVLGQAYHGASRLLDTNNLYVALYDPEREEVTFPLYVTEREVEWPYETRRAANGLTEYIIRTRAPLLIEEDVAEWMEEKGVDSIGKTAFSWLGVPLMVGDRVLGVMAVQSHTAPHVYDEHDRDLLTTIANQAAIAIQNAYLFEEMEAALAETETLHQASAEFNAAQTYDEILHSLCNHTILGQTDCNVTIDVFEHPWTDEQVPGEFTVVARRSALSVGGVNLRHPLPPGSSNLLRSDAPTIVLDVENDPCIDEEMREIFLQGLESRCMILVPLVVGGKWVGFVNGTYSDPIDFRRAELRRLMSLSGQAAAAVQSILLLQETRRRATYLTVAAAVARDATGILDVDELLDATVDLIRERFGFYYAAIFLMDAEGEKAILRAAAGQAGERMLENAHVLPVGAGSIVGHVAAEGEPWISNDVESDPRHLPNPLLPETRCELGLPLQVRGQVIGVLDVQSTRKADFSSDDMATLQTLADQVASAIENARLYQETHLRAEQLAVVNRIARAASSTLHLDDLVETVYHEIVSNFVAGAFFIALYDQDTEELEFRIRVDEGVREHPDRLPVGKGLTGLVVTKKEPLLIRDYEREQERLPQPARRWGTMKVSRSWLGVPMQIGERVVGVICVQAYTPNAYGEEEKLLLSTIADQVAVAIDNARLYQRERRRAEELAALNAIAVRLGRSLELEEVMEAAMEEVLRALKVQASAVSLVDEEEEALLLRAQRGLRYSHVGMRIPVGQGLSGHVVRTGQAVVTGDVGDDPRLAVPDFAREQVQAMTLVPMHSRGKVVGLLSAMAHSPREFTDREIALLRAIANQVGSAVENAQLYQSVKEHVERLEEAYTKLQEVDRLKDELIQNVSHELRTPLTFVKGYVQLLIDEELGPLTEEQRESLDVMARKTDHLVRLVKDIVTLEAVSRQTLNLELVDLGELAQMGLEDCRFVAEEANIELRKEIPEDLPRVLGDWSRISEVFDNLLDNAIKFSPDGGAVTVRVKEEKDWLRAEVADVGIGIPDEKLSRIFDRFYQADGSSRRRFGGAGLGLAIVKRIIEAHGGEVGVMSEIGKGSVFYFVIPKRREVTS